MFTTDMQIRKWKDKPKTRKSCGKGLYIRIFGDGSKTFELRTKQQWVTLGQYPILSLADASDVMAAAAAPHPILNLSLTVSLNPIRKSLNPILEPILEP